MNTNDNDTTNSLNGGGILPWVQGRDESIASTERWIESLQNLSLIEMSQKLSGPEADSWRMSLRLNGLTADCSAVIEFTVCNPHGVIPTESATGLLHDIASSARLSPDLISTLLDLSLTYGLELEPALADCHNILTHQVAELTKWATRFAAASNDNGQQILRNLVHNPGLTDVGLSMVATASQHDDVLRQVLEHPNATEMVHRFVPERLVEAYLAVEADKSVALLKAEEMDGVWNSFEAGTRVHEDFAVICNPETPAWVLHDLMSTSDIRLAMINSLMSDKYYRNLGGYSGEDDDWDDAFLEL